VSRIGARVLQALLFGLLAGCGEKLPPFVPVKLPSGRMVKVQSYLPESLFTGEEALVLKFVPDCAIDDEAALDAEVASLWREIKKEAQEGSGAKLVLIRAISQTAKGWDPGAQAQYVYRLQPDGSWRMEKDPDVRLH
jgi:hypothetical protein